MSHDVWDPTAGSVFRHALYSRVGIVDPIYTGIPGAALLIAEKAGVYPVGPDSAVQLPNPDHFVPSVHPKPKSLPSRTDQLSEAAIKYEQLHVYPTFCNHGLGEWLLGRSPCEGWLLLTLAPRNIAWVTQRHHRQSPQEQPSSPRREVRS